MSIRMSLLAAALTLIAASTARASTVNATFTNVTPNNIVDIHFDNTSLLVYAGAMQWQRNASNPGDYAGLQGNFSTFCIELRQDVYFNSNYSYDVVPVTQALDPDHAISAVKLDRLTRLWSAHIGDTTTADGAAAFQLAIWNIVDDTDNDVTSGTFYDSTSGNFNTLANNWLVNLPTTSGNIDLLALSSPTAQDQIFGIPHTPGVPPVNPVPLPASGALALPALLALPFVRKLRRHS